MLPQKVQLDPLEVLCVKFVENQILEYALKAKHSISSYPCIFN